VTAQTDQARAALASATANNNNLCRNGEKLNDEGPQTSLRTTAWPRKNARGLRLTGDD
jgi:hypothetical protein